jgi:hypothetical protein
MFQRSRSIRIPGTCPQARRLPPHPPAGVILPPAAADP